MRRVVRFVHLSRSKQRLLLEAVWLLARVRLMLALLRFEVAMRRLDAMAVSRGGRDRSTPSLPDDVDADALLWAVRTASRIVPRATCLTQALGARVMFLRRGMPVDVHVGVARGAAGTFEAHAWVERNGRIVLGDLPDLDRYARIPTPWAGTP